MWCSSVFRRGRTFAAAALVASLPVLAACGSDTATPAAAPAATSAAGGATTMPDMPGMSTSPAAGGAAAGAPVATTAVAIENFAFSPATITVQVGTTVTWTNKDSDPHTVTAKSGGAALDSPTLNQGDSYQYTFTKAGQYTYLCTIHPFMLGTVMVTP
jgi:amicyanin